MAQSAAESTGFIPSTCGFGFTNSWPSAPAVTVQTPFGAIGIGNASAGLCGGMVFAALDYWLAGQPPPADRPAPGTPLYGYIVLRLIDSWHLPGGAAEYYQWMNLPDADSTVDLFGRTFVAQRGVSWRTIEQEWPQVKASIDAGTPAALGIVAVSSVNPGQLGENHQVLACGYSSTGTKVTIEVYDPNSGPQDGVQISFDAADPSRATTFASNINLRLPVRGFFLTAYSPASPPPATGGSQAAG